MYYTQTQAQCVHTHTHTHTHTHVGVARVEVVLMVVLEVRSWGYSDQIKLKRCTAGNIFHNVHI